MRPYGITGAVRGKRRTATTTADASASRVGESGRLAEGSAEATAAVGGFVSELAVLT